MTFNDMMVFVKEKNHVTARARIQYHIRGIRQWCTFSASIPVACDSLYPALPLIRASPLSLENAIGGGSISWLYDE